METVRDCLSGPCPMVTSDFYRNKEVEGRIRIRVFIQRQLNKSFQMR